MTKKIACATATLLFAIAAPAAAQIYVSPEVAFASDFNIGVGFGVEVPVEEVNDRFSIHGNALYFFPGESAEEIPGVDADVDYWELNANGRFRIPLADQSWTPYLGAGLNIGRVSGSVSIDGVGSTKETSTELGVNVLGGVQFGDGASRPFVEGRYELGGGEQFVLSGGISLAIGG